jgi:hypothetical protein
MTLGLDGDDGEPSPKSRTGSASLALAPEPEVEGSDGANGRIALRPEAGGSLLAYPGSLYLSEGLC